MSKLLICDPVDASAIDEMRAAGIEVDVRDDISQEALSSIIGGYDGIVVRSRTKVGAALIDRATSLKVIIRGGVGLDTIDVAHAKSKGISVQNTPAANSNAVVELALGMMLTLARHVTRADAGMKAGKWEKKALEGTEIAGKTLGVVGYGRIGQMLGEKARLLGMTIVAYDPFVEHPDIVSLDALLAASDYISVHVPLNKETADLLDAAAFAKMKPGVILIQASRGGTVNETALYEALVSGKVAGAGLDVFTEEPPKSEAVLKLAALPQVVATPHIGAATAEALERVGGEIVTLAKAALA
ncbi:MAG: D-2-hydroxyacid dehydrogenase [Anaerolineae bacterium]|nr:D-2-hydroxyacid dehydrogenase [Anaerolineae bacterium]